jgi:hypothetical protein
MASGFVSFLFEGCSLVDHDVDVNDSDFFVDEFVVDLVTFFLGDGETAA